MNLKSRSVNIAWKIMMIPNLIMVPFGIIFMVIPDAILSNSYSLFSGQSWSTLSPKTVEFILMTAGRMYGTYVMAMVILLFAITLKSFRKGERWSWYTLLIAYTFGTTIHATALLILGEMPIASLNIVFLLLVYIALGISAKDMLSTKST